MAFSNLHDPITVPVARLLLAENGGCVPVVVGSLDTISPMPRSCSGRPMRSSSRSWSVVSRRRGILSDARIQHATCPVPTPILLDRTTTSCLPAICCQRPGAPHAAAAPNAMLSASTVRGRACAAYRGIFAASPKKEVRPAR